MALKAGAQSQRAAIAAAVLVLTTLLILYGSSAGEGASAAAAATPFRMAKNHTPKATNLKTWAGKDDYVPVYGEQNMSVRCQRCALVSSSSHVLGSKAGEEIDGSECVIRMNDAPTSGYEADVGRRTTLRVVAHSSVYRLIRRPGDFLGVGAGDPRTIIFWGPPHKIAKNSKATVYRSIQRMSATFKRVSCFFVSPRKMYRFDNLFQLETGRNRQGSGTWLSTGFFTMVIAIELCDNIKVYGMVPPNYCARNRTRSEKLPYHYYMPRGSDECVMYMQNQNDQKGSHHRFITEKEVFARWAQHYNITFVYPTW